MLEITAIVFFALIIYSSNDLPTWKVIFLVISVTMFNNTLDQIFDKYTVENVSE